MVRALNVSHNKFSIVAAITHGALVLPTFHHCCAVLLLSAEVPPGNYIDNGVVKPCEKGYYRVGISTPALATSCVSCGEGITTTSTGSAARTECTSKHHNGPRHLWCKWTVSCTYWLLCIVTADAWQQHY